MKNALLLLATIILFSSCTENYSNGERIGFVTQFSRTGVMWKSHEGHLNMTQTGMNSSQPFDFSVDNDNEDQRVVSTLDSAATLGWKVKLRYHETMGKNWLNNRGDTNHFVTTVEVLDKKPMENLFGNQTPSTPKTTNKTDTIYIIVLDPQWVKQLPDGTIIKKSK
jgi:hypothetical protein